MKRILLLLITIFAILFLAACGPSNNESEATDDESSEPAVEEDIVPRVTVTSTPGSEDDAYPGEAGRPTATPLPEGYPEPVAPTEVPESYPADGEAGAVYVAISAGVQCEDALYNSEDEAIAALEATGVEVDNSQTIELMVTQSCGSPMSTHYVAEISASDMATAEDAGWQEIPESELNR